MSQADQDQRIDYLEFQATDIGRLKSFYHDVFGWQFTDYGPDYTSFHDGRLAGGFRRVDELESGGVLVVIYACDLEATEARIKSSGGHIVVETFEFPGGKRFHFADPNGNVLAVWSE